jgi:molybdopterin-containing oxidoreductase family iron-sulfur binding subunit
VRRFNFYNFTKDTPETLQMAYNPDVTVRARGVMEKCTYCVQRLARAQRDAKLGNREMQDGEARTACQQACPAVAIEFGDMRDPKSRIAASKQSPRRYDLLSEFNTKPRTSYLSRLRNPNPELSA